MSLDPRSPIALKTAPRAVRTQSLSPARPIAELDRVTVGSEVKGDRGEIVPSGSSGTVVAIWGAGAAFEVEFEKPVAALATVKAESIAAHHPRQPR